MIESQRKQFLDYIAKTKRMSVHTVSAYSGDLFQFTDFFGHPVRDCFSGLQTHTYSGFHGDVAAEWPYTSFGSPEGFQRARLV
jgi:site-specific recombinase XerD